MIKEGVKLARKEKNVLIYAGFFFIILGCKLLTIFSYGNATPFWDQWDAEGSAIYIPLLKGNFHLNTLFAAHNEHRILTTRLAAILLIKINEIWNPLLQMVFNSILHALTLCINLFIFSKIVGKKWLPQLAIINLVLYIIPFGWENTLAGFQSQFYFVVLFSVVSMWILVLSQPFSFRWFIGVIIGTSAYFSLASGAFVFAAMFAMEIIRVIIRKKIAAIDVILIISYATIFMLEINFTPVCHHHDPLKASSINQFIHSYLTVSGWPLSLNMQSALWASPILIYFPALIYLVVLLRKKIEIKNIEWFLVAILIWIIGGEVSISYGRALGNLSSRYTDLYLFKIFFNFVLLLVLCNYSIKKNKPIFYSLSVLWVIIVLIGLCVTGNKTLCIDLDNKKNSGITEEINIKSYILSGDIEVLLHKQQLDIPYPDPRRLAQLLSDPELRSILPSNINNINKYGRLDSVITFMLKHSIYFILFGFICVMSYLLVISLDFYLKISMNKQLHKISLYDQ